MFEGGGVLWGLLLEVSAVRFCCSYRIEAVQDSLGEVGEVVVTLSIVDFCQAGEVYFG